MEVCGEYEGIKTATKEAKEGRHPASYENHTANY